jgi:class 3 adenylate cyclase
MPTQAEPHRKLAAILSADVVGYSRLMQADEQATLDTLKSSRTVIAGHIERHRGRVVNAPGDAILAAFPSAVEAVRCAVEIQQDLQERNIALSPERRMQYRIGVNLGDVIEETDGTLYGDGVNIAARLEGLAEAGGVCISGKVFDEVKNKLDLGFQFLGAQSVKHIADPVRAYRVAPQAGAGGSTPSDRSPKRRLHATWGIVCGGIGRAGPRRGIDLARRTLVIR